MGRVPTVFQALWEQRWGRGIPGVTGWERIHHPDERGFQVLWGPRWHPPPTRKSLQTQDFTRTWEDACDLTSCQYHLSIEELLWAN